ncbi:hypothetical protein [Williamsia sp. CHRR-6]|uniref:hypothetical protein n=1 Tax=Williamsia sp. CHRR-6 TaxID=2835871 RepID=UPI001BDA2023|nr:hypothetical protein [Williamsia sp. CHRR-6]MBT0565501.1 hypothetical protein [Williamsia sp. CHRR-6]
MLTGTPDLDDLAGLQAADVDGRLRLAALAGAQVRAIGEAVREDVLAPLARLRPRAVVVVAGRGTASRAAQLVSAVMAPWVDVPIVTASTLPGWVGPLDVVVVTGDDAGERVLADAAARAARRRAELVVDVPLEGPLADAASGAALDLSPRVPVPGEFRFIGHVVALLAVLTALRHVRTASGVPELSELADLLDEEAARNHPGHEMFHNAAKALATRVADRSTAWAGDTPAATVVAEHAARTFYAIAGVSAVGGSLSEAMMASVAVPEMRSTAVESIFHDPEIDGALTLPTRVQVVSSSAWEWVARRRMSTLADADLLTATPVDEPGRGVDTVAEPVDSPADLASLLVVALRIELAAVYLRLIGTSG